MGGEEQGDALLGQAALFCLLWDEVELGDSLFLVGRVTAEPNDLKPVVQGLGDVVLLVGRGNEEDLV